MKKTETGEARKEICFRDSVQERGEESTRQKDRKV